MTLAAASPREQLTPARRLAATIVRYYPVPFLVVGLSVLFLRLEDLNAWLLALMFAGFIAAAPVAHLEGVFAAPLRRFMFSYMIMLDALVPAVFYWFFATFPVRSPIDKKFPKLKYVLAAISLAAALPFSGMALITGSSFMAMKVLSRFE